MLKEKLNAQKIVLALVFLVGVYWIIGSLQLDLWIRNGPGGGFLPLLAGILCVGFSGVILLREWKKESDTAFSVRALIPWGALIGMILCGKLIGIFLSLVLFVFLWLRLFEKFPLRNSILTAVIWPGFLYLIFVVWLGSPLPKGLLGLL